MSRTKALLGARSAGALWNAFALVSVAFSAWSVMATKYCHNWDGTCDVEVDSGNAIYKLWSRHDNGREDRIWTFYEKSVPFATSHTHWTGWLNNWDQPVDWSSSSAYMVGWYSDHSNSAEDRRFRIKYRNLKSGYTRKSCQWSGYNGWDAEANWGGGDHYVFGIYSYHDNGREDRRTKFYWCNVQAPSPPPPPPPSPPPPSPLPPGGRYNGPKIEVKIGNPVLVVTDSEFDFDIQVNDPDGCTNGGKNCFSLSNFEQNYKAGLRCNVYVGDKDCGTSVSKTTLDFLKEGSCMQWNNFFDRSKLGELKKFLKATDQNANLAAGHYWINYNCHWEKSDGSVVPSSQTGWKKLHEFTVSKGCANKLSHSLNSNDNSALDSTLARLFLMSAPKFLSASCDVVDVSKEELFRSFDNDPLDGKLSAKELKEAFSKHDSDITYLEYVEISGYFAEKGGILLSEVMNSDALPMQCNHVDETPDVFMTQSGVTYPTLETTKEECDNQTERVDVEWDYNKQPTTADFMCIYVDGLFYKRVTGKAKAEDNIKAIVDERPSTGVGAKAMQLIDHFTFDAQDFRNVAPSNSDAGTIGKVTGTEFTSCGEGKFCLDRKSNGNSPEFKFKLPGRHSMRSSAVMSWFSFENEAGTIWRSDYGEPHDRRFGVDKNGYVYAEYYNEEKLTSKKKLVAHKFAHVAMLLNKENGLSIYIDGERVAHRSIVQNANIDFPSEPLDPTICDAKGIYDDFRIYNGVVTEKHLKSIYNCGQSFTCTKLAHAKPQSRRTYCIIPKYQNGGHKKFVTPCATVSTSRVRVSI